MRRTATASLNAHIAISSKSHKRQKEGTFISYSEGLENLVETYATHDVIAETGTDLKRFSQPTRKSLTEFTEAL